MIPTAVGLLVLLYCFKLVLLMILALMHIQIEHPLTRMVADRRVTQALTQLF